MRDVRPSKDGQPPSVLGLGNVDRLLKVFLVEKVLRYG